VALALGVIAVETSHATILFPQLVGNDFSWPEHNVSFVHFLNKIVTISVCFVIFHAKEKDQLLNHS